MPGVPEMPGVLVGAPVDMLRVYCSADSSRRKTLELIPSIPQDEQKRNSCPKKCKCVENVEFPPSAGHWPEFGSTPGWTATASWGRIFFSINSYFNRQLDFLLFIEH